jgi:hypothetical protein
LQTVCLHLSILPPLEENVKLHHPPAFCLTHGIFVATTLSLGEGSTLSAVGAITDCPTCGAISEVLPGRYDVVGGRLNLLLDPSITPEALTALRAIAERLQRNVISRQEAEREAASISSRFTGLFRGIKQETVATVAAAIITAIGAVIVARESSPNTTINYYGPPPAAVTDVADPAASYQELPDYGPTPAPKPQPLNRHERRKLLRIQENRTIKRS